MITTQVFDECCKTGVKKLLTFMGGCAYPAKAPSPIPEDMMWDGFPQEEGAPYSVAKKIVLVQSETYRRQHGFNSVVVIPGNVYGEYDNFHEEESHVIPALIRRFIEAKDNNQPELSCYGSGNPTRDFVYAGDVAAVTPWFLTNYDSSEPVNISSGTRISVKELAETIQEITGYKGSIAWDKSKPDGQMDKIFCVKRLHELGLSCDTSLEDGLKKTIDWFISNRDKGTVRL
jgi:GDP-L-fucose synthase